MNIPNLLTTFRILLTPIFIICLFYDHPLAKIWALFIFIIASITDAYDGYYARKYNQVTQQGKFLDPLADKILVSSAFISFAVIGIVEYWMVALIIFRDLFVTGLRMAMEYQGFSLLTSAMAKVKTGTQITVIIFILIFMALRGFGFGFEWLHYFFDFVKEYRLIYYLTFIATVFTVWTGIHYIYNNRFAIRSFFT